MSTSDEAQATSTAAPPDRRQAPRGVRVGWRSPEERPLLDGEFAFRCRACTAANTASGSHYLGRVKCRRCARSFWLERRIRGECEACDTSPVYPFRLGGHSVPCENCGESLTLRPAEARGHRSKQCRFRQMEQAAIRAMAVLGVLLVLCATMIAVLILNR